MLDAEVMLVVLSQPAATSPEVKNEWRYWVGCLKKPLVTLLLEECRIPYRLFPRQHLRASGRPLDQVTAEVVAALEKANEYAQRKPGARLAQPGPEAEAPSEPRAPEPAGTIRTLYLPLVQTALSDLHVKPDLTLDLRLSYVPGVYQFPDLPGDLSSLADTIQKRRREH